MNYPFVCPECGYREIIPMLITEYKAEGHMCKQCSTEMKRDIASFGSVAVDKTNSFCNKVSI